MPSRTTVRYRPDNRPLSPRFDGSAVSFIRFLESGVFLCACSRGKTNFFQYTYPCVVMAAVGAGKLRFLRDNISTYQLMRIHPHLRPRHLFHHLSFSPKPCLDKYNLLYAVYFVSTFPIYIRNKRPKS